MFRLRSKHEFLPHRASASKTAAPTTSENYHCAVDLSNITSRVMGMASSESKNSTPEFYLAMRTPNELSPDDSSPSTADLARMLLDAQYADMYILYSLDAATDARPTYRREFFQNKVRLRSNLSTTPQSFHSRRSISRCSETNKFRRWSSCCGFARRSPRIFSSRRPMSPCCIVT